MIRKNQKIVENQQSKKPQTSALGQHIKQNAHQARSPRPNHKIMTDSNSLKSNGLTDSTTLSSKKLAQTPKTTKMNSQQNISPERQKRFSEYCEVVTEMIKKSVSQVNQIIERDHTPHGRRPQANAKSKSRLENDDSQGQELIDSVTQVRMMRNNIQNQRNTGQVSQPQLQHHMTSLNQTYQSPLKDLHQPDLLTDLSFDSDKETPINQNQANIKQGKQTNQSFLSTQNQNNKGFGLWNINAKIINKQYLTASSVITPSNQPQDELFFLSAIKIQRFYRNRFYKKTFKFNIKRFKELFIAVIRGKKVRMILKRAELSRLAREIKDLAKLQKLNFNSRTGYATKVFAEKKSQFMNLFKSYFYSDQKTAKVMVDFQAVPKRIQTEANNQSISSADNNDNSEDISEDQLVSDLKMIKESNNQVFQSYINISPKHHDTNMDSGSSIAWAKIQIQLEATENEVITTGCGVENLKKPHHRKILSNDYSIGRAKSKSTHQENQTRINKNQCSPKQAPSLVDRLPDRYKNSKHKNFLKKRSGHEYDPKQAVQIDTKKSRSGSRVNNRPNSAQRITSSSNKHYIQKEQQMQSTVKFKPLALSKIAHSQIIALSNLTEKPKYNQQQKDLPSVRRVLEKFVLPDEKTTTYQNSDLSDITTPIKTRNIVQEFAESPIDPMPQQNYKRHLSKTPNQSHLEFKSNNGEPQQNSNKSGNYMIKENPEQQQIPHIISEKFSKLKDLFVAVQAVESLNPKEQLQMQNKFDRIIDEMKRDFKICLKKK